MAAHWLIVTPYALLGRVVKNTSERLHKIQKEQGYRRTFKGPVRTLK